MATVATFYERLEVDRDADPAEIERAYRERVKETHPDVTDADGEEFKRVTVARDVLLEGETRRRYDRIGHARYVQDHLDPGNWPDVGERPPPRRSSTRRRRRDRRHSPGRSVGNRSRPNGRSYTDRVRRYRAGRGVDTHGVRATAHVTHSPQQNPYVPHDRDVAELASALQSALYHAFVCSFAITALVLSLTALVLLTL